MRRRAPSPASVGRWRADSRPQIRRAADYGLRRLPGSVLLTADPEHFAELELLARACERRLERRAQVLFADLVDEDGPAERLKRLRLDFREEYQAAIAPAAPNDVR